MLRASECIWGPLQGPLDLPDDPQVQANGYLLDSPGPDGPVRVCANPVQFGGAPPRIERGAQDAGAQTEEVLLELGCSWDEIAAWKDAGAIA
jgi:crotonobetainyl-CoA:carnitine CoA-transferase CaiB-like acyl-CoA transferase